MSIQLHACTNVLRASADFTGREGTKPPALGLSQHIQRRLGNHNSPATNKLTETYLNKNQTSVKLQT